MKWNGPASVGGTADRPCPEGSNIDLLRYGKGVVNLNAEVANRALDLGMAEQQLDGTQVPGSAVDQRDLCSAQRVGSEKAWVQANAGNPPGHQPRILPGRNELIATTTTGE